MRSFTAAAIASLGRLITPLPQPPTPGETVNERCHGLNAAHGFTGGNNG